MDWKQQGSWKVLVVLLVILSFNIIYSEAAISNCSTIPGRRLLQTKDTSNDISRIDPLSHFNNYRGRYDITNEHYWSSTICTGIYGYAIGLVWLIAGIAYCIYLLSTNCCLRNKKIQKKRRVPCQKQCYIFPLVLAIFFAVLAVIASGFVLERNMRFHSRAKTVVSLIMNTADEASHTMYNATGAMRKISVNLKRSGSIEGDAAANYLATTSDKLGYEATGIKTQAQKNRNLVGKALTILYIVTAATISLNLAAVIVLTVFGILRFRRLVQMLVILCWFLTVLCWLFFGIYFFIGTFCTDTCTALHDFQKTPDNSSLSTILPCDEFISAKTVLFDVSIGIYEVLNEVNANISVLRTNSLPTLNYVCNPFSGPPAFSYQPQSCPADSIHIGDIPQILKMITCSDTSGTNCEEGFITNSEYNVIEAYTTSVQELLDAYPDMENLVNCEFVKDASRDILLNHCKPVKRYVKTTWVSMLMLSIVMVFLITTWASTTFHEQQHHSVNSFVNPNMVEVVNMDPETAQETNSHQVQ